jgi:hypothetical protein
MLQVALQAVAQSSSSSAPNQAPEKPVQRIKQDESKEAQSFQQTHPNWAKNHPRAAAYFKAHPESRAKALGRYGERQFNQQHPNFAKNHPQLARTDYKHPLAAEAHPRAATGHAKR